MTKRDKNKGKASKEITNHDRAKIVIDKKREMRTKEISNMINEGGLGSDNYYDIIKKSSFKEED